MGKRLAEFIEVRANDLPAVRILTPSENMKKYVYTGPITTEGLLKFVEDFKRQNLKAHYKSEDIPDSNEGAVKILVGKTFKSIVFNAENDVLVEYYAPWCGHCKHLAPIYENVARRVASVKNLVIAKMDYTANEIEGIEIEAFPTIIFYPKGNKQNPIPYDGDREEDAFIDFLRKHSSGPFEGVKARDKVNKGTQEL